MAALVIISLSMILHSKQTEESFTYFPEDENAFFLSAETSLTLMKKNSNGYLLLWRIGSILDRKAYLRQDISFLFSNGKLLDKTGESWKQQVDKISLEKKINHKESADFKAISFHHAEIHSDDQISSVQRITHDELYVLDSNFSPLHSFRQPVTKEEKAWKTVLDKLTQQRLQHALQKAKSSYSIHDHLYTTYLLTDMYLFADSPLPGFSEKQTQAIVGRLWEGLYKNYFLGIKKKDGTIADALGSTIPLILLAKDRSHLLVISELENNDVMILKQQIPSH